VGTAQAATLTATSGSVSKIFALQLNAAVPTLSINATSIPFGNVQVNTSATQSVILTSTGTAPVTVNSATMTGTGFSISAASFPATLNPGQAVTVYVEFDPSTVGTASGQLVITSNSSTNATFVIGLSGIGIAAVQVAVIPASASLLTGTTQQFEASVTGTPQTEVTWTVEGTGCTGSDCGTITANGQYTTAAAVPSPATVTITATSVADPDQSASAVVTILPSTGTRYYLAPAIDGGNDSNNGLSPEDPWLTPNHPVNCGDILTAATGTYPEGNFNATFGTVAGSGHCFAILQCATFDACYVIATDGGAQFWVTKSHWWVQGFESRNPNATSTNSCFKASPLTAATIYDIAFVDDIANGCPLGGFITASYYGGGAYGVDYFALIADVAYNAAQSNAECASGISIFQPVNYDTAPGTHQYIAQYFGWDNVDPSSCGGTNATDGEGIILDTFNAFSYSGQTVVENAITVWNGSAGIELWESGYAPVYVKQSTAFADGIGPGLNNFFCGEIETTDPNSNPPNKFFEATANIARTNSTTGCGSNQMYAYFAAYVQPQNVIYGNVGFSAAGNNALCNGTCTGFTFGPNNAFGTDPAFVNAPSRTPSAPSCSGAASVPSCMKTMIANMTPTAAGTAGFGYQPVSATANYNPLFPQWLCQYSNQLDRLVTMGCAAQ